MQARTFLAKASISCARFVPGNASLALLGTVKGDLIIYNAASGREQERVSLKSKQGHQDQGAVQAMAASGSLLLVASSTGALCTYRCSTLNGVLQPLRVRKPHLLPAHGTMQVQEARASLQVSALVVATAQQDR